MSQVIELLLIKNKKNIEDIGENLAEFGAASDGLYFKNKQEGRKLNHIFNWTQSFFTGIAYWAYIAGQDKRNLHWIKSYYGQYYKKVFHSPMETMHDLGFLYTPYAVAMYKLTGDTNMKMIGIKAADELAKRFDTKGNYIKAWGRMDNLIPDYVDSELAKDHFFQESKGLTIVDSMMNIPLLFWAGKETGHPFYTRIAMEQADTTIRYFVRDDYSICHAYRFDESTGEALGEENYCGYQIGSHWARGASWAIYGFAIAYDYTKEQRYLDTAVKLLERFLLECKGNIPVWDFRLPAGTDQSIDTSAAAIALCGGHEILRHIKPEGMQKALEHLENSIKAYIDFNPDVNGILKEQNGKHDYASYGDYFLMEYICMKELNAERIW